MHGTPVTERQTMGRWCVRNAGNMTRRMLGGIACLLLGGGPGFLHAQTPTAVAVRTAVREYREAHEATILRELADLVALPNVARDSQAIEHNAAVLEASLTRRGLTTRRLRVPGSPPAVFGERPTPGARTTIVFYAHYDGQPADAGVWRSPPWTPTLRSRALAEGGHDIPFPTAGERIDPEARIYGRSVSDDKGPIIALLAALDALDRARIPLAVNLKVFLEGEEEAGSGHLAEMLSAHRDLLAADLWLFGDGPIHQSHRPQIVYGVRGILPLRLTVYGATRPLHSGHYGNFAPNPNVLLVHLLASMRDPDGAITIAGFMDDVRPPRPAERAAFASIPAIDAALRAELGLAATEAGNAPLPERLMLPALNIDGLDGGPAGNNAANVIPTEARAALDFRLVPDQDPIRVRALVEAHLTRQGYTVIHEPPTDSFRAAHTRLVLVRWGEGYPAVRTPLDLPIAEALARTASEAIGGPIIQIPMLGGSLPLAHFTRMLGAPVVVLPIVNHDNNQHGADENLRLQNLWDGIELYGAVLARLPGVGPSPVP